MLKGGIFLLPSSPPSPGLGGETRCWRAFRKGRLLRCHMRAICIGTRPLFPPAALGTGSVPAHDTCTSAVAPDGFSGPSPPSRAVSSPSSPAAPGPAAREVGSWDRLSAPELDPQRKNPAGGQKGKQGGQLGGCQREELRREHAQRVWGDTAPLPHLPLSGKANPCS